MPYRIITQGYGTGSGSLIVQGYAGVSRRKWRSVVGAFEDQGMLRMQGTFPTCGIECEDGAFVTFWRDWFRLYQPYGSARGGDGSLPGVQGFGVLHPYSPGYADNYFLPAEPPFGAVAIWRCDGFGGFVGDSPSDCQLVGDLCWHDGALYALGYRVADVAWVQSRGLGAMQPLQLFEDGAWGEVSSPQATAVLKLGLWKREGFTWTQVDAPELQEKYVRSGFAIKGEQALHLYSTGEGLWISATDWGYLGVAGELDDSKRTWATINGTAVLAARTWLLDATGYLRDCGFVASIGEQGGVTQVLASADQYTGPATVRLWGNDGKVVPSRRGVSMTAPVPVSPIRWWRGYFWVGLAEPEGERVYLGRIGMTGDVALIWGRSDTALWSLGGIWNAGTNPQPTRLAVSRHSIMLCREIGLGAALLGPLGNWTPPPDSPSREWVACYEPPVMPAGVWDKCVQADFSGETGEWIVWLDLADAPYSERPLAWWGRAEYGTPVIPEALEWTLSRRGRTTGIGVDPGPGVGERVLHTLCTARGDATAISVAYTGMTVEDAATCRVLVRADCEGNPVDTWPDYERFGLGQTCYLANPGAEVRVAIIGPDDLPDAVDFAPFPLVS